MQVFTTDCLLHHQNNCFNAKSVIN